VVEEDTGKLLCKPTNFADINTSIAPRKRTIEFALEQYGYIFA
jgi:hypothetical protein